jgi:hypothetical protein
MRRLFALPHPNPPTRKEAWDEARERVEEGDHMRVARIA